MWASRYDAATSSWGTAEFIDSDSLRFAHRPRVAFDGSGNALVTWFGGKYTANRYDAATSSWGTAEAIGDNEVSLTICSNMPVTSTKNSWRLMTSSAA